MQSRPGRAGGVTNPRAVGRLTGRRREHPGGGLTHVNAAHGERGRYVALPLSGRLVLRHNAEGAGEGRADPEGLDGGEHHRVARRPREGVRRRRVLPAPRLRHGPRRGRVRSRRAAGVPLPRLRVRHDGAVRRHPLRRGSPDREATGLRDARGGRPGLRVVGNRRTRAAMALAGRPVRPDRLERADRVEGALSGPPAGDDGELRGPGPPALRPRLRQRGARRQTGG